MQGVEPVMFDQSVSGFFSFSTCRRRRHFKPAGKGDESLTGRRAKKPEARDSQPAAAEGP